MKKPTLTALNGGKAEETACANSAHISRDEDLHEFYNKITVDVLARTLWGEARGEGNIGLQAVANVVQNRVKIAENRGGKFWWGANIIQVCQKPYQFSCWNRSDPSFRKLQAVDERNLYFATALRIARRAVLDLLPDVTKGATHYHANYVSPYWSEGKTPTVTIGNHIFYKLVDLKKED